MRKAYPMRTNNRSPLFSITCLPLLMVLLSANGFGQAPGPLLLQRPQRARTDAAPVKWSHIYQDPDLHADSPFHFLDAQEVNVTIECGIYNDLLTEMRIPITFLLPGAVATRELSRTACNVRGFSGIPVSSTPQTEKTVVRIYPRDCNIEHATLDRFLQDSRLGLGNQGPYRIILLGSSVRRDDVSREVPDLTRLSQTVHNAIDVYGQPRRFVAFSKTLMLYPWPLDDLTLVRARAQRVADFARGENFEALLTSLNSRASRPRAAEYVSSFFDSLERDNLLDDRLETHRVIWEHQIRPSLHKNEASVESQVPVVTKEFLENLRKATASNSCTVEVFSSPSTGATIKYAKKADADRGVYAEHSQPTFAAFEVEKALYEFQLYRSAKMTAQKSRVDCTNSRQAVLMQE